MTTAEFDALTIGGLHTLHERLMGAPTHSNNKPALQKKLRNLACGRPEAPALAPPPRAPAAPKAARKAKKKPAKAAKPKPAAKAKAPDAARADREARIRKLAKSGLSIRKVCRALEAEGIKTARGGKRWHTASVTAVLDRAS
jgi:hypothetical protein